MIYKVKIIFENGETFFAKTHFKIIKPLIGHLIFNTSVVGYQEVLTDPSYSQQILVFTFPLIGTYPVNPLFHQSSKIQPVAIIVNQMERYSFNDQGQVDTITFEKWLKKENKPLIFGLDTRELTKYIRNLGSLKAMIVSISFLANDAVKLLKGIEIDKHVHKLSLTKNNDFIFLNPNENITLIVYDLGIKKALIDQFLKFKLKLIIVPYYTKYSELRTYNPSAFFFSNGPGDPNELGELVSEIKLMLKNKETVLGVCLGHQLIGLALGYKINKLLFGHHSINHPVKNLITNKVFITSQNHDYYLEYDKKIRPYGQKEIISNFQSLLDNSNEGLESKDYKIYSVQFHPEANPGPEEGVDVFEEFYKRIIG